MNKRERLSADQTRGEEAERRSKTERSISQIKIGSKSDRFHREREREREREGERERKRMKRVTKAVRTRNFEFRPIFGWVGPGPARPYGPIITLVALYIHTQGLGSLLGVEGC